MCSPRESRRFVPENGGNGQLAVLIHGLFLFGFMMNPIGKRLAKAGYTSVIYDYPTMKKGLAGHGQDLADFLKRLSDSSPDSRINIVTHSLGGITARSAISFLPPETVAKIRRIVMLAPPNKGSDVAGFFTEYLPFTGKIARPLPELSSSEASAIHSVPQINSRIEVGIIAGTRDIEVRNEYTHLSGEKAHVTIRCGHTLMPFLPETGRLVISFMNTGSF